MPNSLPNNKMLIHTGILITQNLDRQVIEDAGILIGGGEILAVGDYPAVKQNSQDAELLDLASCLVMPGLINTHTHAAMTLYRGLADDLPLMEWLNDHIFPAEAKLEPEAIRLGTTLACAEMIRYGTTSFVDLYFFARTIAQTADECGLRAVVGEGILKFPTPSNKSVPAMFEATADLLEGLKHNSRIRGSVVLHSVYLTDEDIITRSLELSEKYACPWQIHLAETRTETSQCLDIYGRRPVQVLKDLNGLNGRSLLAHCVDLNREEIELLGDIQAKIAHNPESNMKLASGIAPVYELLLAGAVVGIGTDGAASNNNLNMFTEMESAALIHKPRLSDPTVMCAQTVLDMATINGAKCMGFENTGSIEPGKRADLIALDMNAPNLQPMYNPVSQSVYAACGSEVRLTMVDGKILYKDGRYLTIDYPALLREVKSYCARFPKRL